MRVNLGYHIENNKVVWDNQVQNKKVTNKAEITETGSLKDIVQVQCQNDPDAPLLRSDRTNKLLDGGLHVLLDYDFYKLPKLEIQDNTLNVPLDKAFSIGEFGGKPSAMRLFSFGGMESCVNMMGSDEIGRVSNKVTPFELMLHEFPKTYSPNEQKAISDKSCTIQFLTNIARGIIKPELFKEFANNVRLDLKKELQSLGFDLSKEFTVNGKKFLFKDGELTFNE